MLAATAAVFLAACAGLGGDAQDAEELLRQTNEAMAEVESMTFSIRVTGEAQGEALPDGAETLSLDLDGGAYIAGESAGDLYMTGSMQAPGLPATSFGLVSEDGKTYLDAGTGWMDVSDMSELGALGAAEEQEQLQQELEAQFADFDLTRFVKDVEVTRDTEFLGEPVTKLVGVIDTAGLFEGVFGQLEALGPIGGIAVPEDATSQVTDALGDTRIVLYISEATHLVRAARITLTMDAEGTAVDLVVDIAIDDVNEPIELPDVPLAA